MECVRRNRTFNFMQENVAAKLKALRGRAGMTVRELADVIGRPPSTYASYEDKYKKPYLPIDLVKQLLCLVGRGDPPITEAEIYALSGVQAGGAQPIERPRPVGVQTRSDESGIAELDVRAEAGMGALTDETDHHEAVVDNWRIPPTLLRAQTSAPMQSLRIISVYGDSMAPDFMPGERVLVDTDDKRPSPAGVFVLWDGFGLVIKRVEMVPYSDPPTARLISRNSQYGTYERPAADIKINGRVIGKWQWT